MSIPEPKTKAWHDRRRLTLGGSDANILLNGSASDILNLWRIKTGAAEPENLDDVFRVQLGIVTEDLNAAWFERKTGSAVIARNDFRKSIKHPFMAANLDGEVVLPNGVSAVFEAKHTGPRSGESASDVLPKYQPQLHHNMIVTGHRKAFLSVIIGNEWDYVEVDFNEEYAAALLNVETDFWECVTLGMPPTDPSPPPPPPPEATKAIDMTGDNEWAAFAADWLSKKTPAKEFADAVAALKAKVPADAKSVKGHGITITRNKARALSIKEESK